MNNKFDEDYIKNYLMKKYKEINHNPTHMKFASLSIGKQYKCCPKEIFHFMIENKHIRGKKTHLFCFLTKKGREIREKFGEIYISKMIKK